MRVVVRRGIEVARNHEQLPELLFERHAAKQIPHARIHAQVGALVRRRGRLREQAGGQRRNEQQSDEHGHRVVLITVLFRGPRTGTPQRRSAQNLRQIRSKNWHACWSREGVRVSCQEAAMTVQPRYLIGAAIGVPVLAMLMFRGPLTAAAPGNTLNASNSMFGCEESQQLVVKQVAVGNELQLAMKCVDTPARTAAYVDESAVPRAFRVSQPISTVRTVSAAPAAPRTVTRQVEQPKRSWQKTALVIGGSAGAGAGVGAIAGGKKGALIGAAIGGGAASIFEAIKR